MFGPSLKQWRVARRLTQEQLAHDAEISTRHLSCLETGKAKPSREMVLVLASALELELRERNSLLGHAGFAAVYASEGLDSARMAAVRRAIDLVLAQQEPWGAVVVDRAWNVLKMNDGARVLSRFSKTPKVMANAVRAVLHPDGLKTALVNWGEVAAFTLQRLERECARHPHDEARAALLREVKKYPGVAKLELAARDEAPASVLHLRRGDDEVRLFTLLTTIGTPLDVTAEELTIESYFPADAASERWLRR